MVHKDGRDEATEAKTSGYYMVWFFCDLREMQN